MGEIQREIVMQVTRIDIVVKLDEINRMKFVEEFQLSVAALLYLTALHV